MRQVLIIGMCIVSGLCQGQYIYFETTSSQSLNGWAENLGALEIFEGRYFTWGIGIGTFQSEQADRYFIQEYDSTGEYVDGLNIYLPFQFLYTGVTNTFQKAIGEDAFYAMGTKVDTVSTKGYVMKISSDLDTLWTREYTLYEPNTQIDASTPTNDGGLYLAGSYGVAVGERGTYIAEIDADGNLLWHQSIHEPNEGVFRNRYISKLPSGFVVSGAEGAGLDTEGRIEYLNEAGEYQWHIQGQGGLLRGIMPHLIKDNGDIISIQGLGYEIIPGGSDISDTYTTLQVHKVDIDNAEFSETYNYLTEYDLVIAGPIDAIESHDNSIVIMGVANKLIGSEQNQVSWICRINENYELEWFTEFTYNTCASCTNLLWDLEQAPDGGYTMAGLYRNSNSSDPYSKTWLVKVDACGDLEFNGCWPVGIGEFENQDLKFKIYPNPAHDYIVIEANNSLNWKTLFIRDQKGRLVQSLALGENGQIQLVDVSALASGLYQLSIEDESGQKVYTNKLTINR